jgi:hypothetical protein
MRSLTTMLLLASLLFWRPAYAQTPPLSPQQRYDQQKKSPALALTMEALCPIAGAGGFYGGDTDKAALLAVISGVAAGVGVGSVLWLVHLDDQSSSGFGAVTKGAAQSTAISLLVTSAVVYLLSRASGLVVASDATAAYNADLQQRLGAQPD